MTTKPLNLSESFSTLYSNGAEKASDDKSFNKSHSNPVKTSHSYGEDDFSSVEQVGNAIQRAVKSRPIFRNICDVTEGLLKSKIFRIVVDTALVGITIGVLFALISNPVGWIATALGVSLLAAKFIFAAGAISAVALLGIIPPFPTKKTIEFEVTAIKKLLKSNNFNKIPAVKGQNYLYLGALPNALKNYETMQTLVERNGTVIAVMEDWELTPRGLSIPMTRKDYNELDIKFIAYSAPDHKIIPPDRLDRLADEIEKGLKNGNVYVHCKGGAGRSAAAVAAYLMKYENKSIVEACAWIKQHRRNSTIWNKLDGLRNYQKHIQTRHNISLTALPQSASDAADILKTMEATGKKPKLSDETIEELQNQNYPTVVAKLPPKV